jgi:hypothetical protein
MSKKQYAGSNTPLQCGSVVVVVVVSVMVVTVVVVVVETEVVVTVVVVVPVVVVPVVVVPVVVVRVVVVVVVVVVDAVVVVVVDVVSMQVPQVTGQSTAIALATIGLEHWSAWPMQAAGSGTPLQCGVVVVDVVVDVLVLVEVVHEPHKVGHFSWMSGPSSDRSHMPALKASHWSGSGVPKQFGVVTVVVVLVVRVLVVFVFVVTVVDVAVVVVVESTQESHMTGQSRRTTSSEISFSHWSTL